jgi:hypothetical protein
MGVRQRKRHEPIRTAAMLRSRTLTTVRCPKCRQRIAQLWTSPGGDGPVKDGVPFVYDGIIWADCERDSGADFRFFNWTCQRKACGWRARDDRLAILIRWAQDTGQREVTFGQTVPTAYLERQERLVWGQLREW